MRKSVYKNGRVVVDTGCKGFDNFIQAFNIGNTSGGGCDGAYIRNAHELECNGKTYTWGQLRDWDLQQFGSASPYVKNYIREKSNNPDNGSILCYVLYNPASHKKENIRHGYIITHNDMRNYELIAKLYTGGTTKSNNVLDICAPYLSNRPLMDSEKTLVRNDKGIEERFRDFVDYDLRALYTGVPNTQETVLRLLHHRAVDTGKGDAWYFYWWHEVLNDAQRLEFAAPYIRA